MVVLDKNVEYYLKPNSSYLRYRNKIDINRYGMRSEDFSKEDFFDQTVFIFGDSVVYGNHFIDQSETIARQLCHGIAVHGKKKLCASVAASSWGPGNILEYYKKFGPFKGNFAFIVQSSYDRVDIPNISSDVIPYRLEPSITASTDFFHFAIEKYNQITGGYAIMPTMAYEKRLLAAEESLEELIKLLKIDFNHVALVYHSTKKELSTANENNESANHFQSISKEKKIAFINTISLYKAQFSPDILYWDNIHLTAKGARYLAEILKERIEDTGIGQQH